MVRLVVQGSQGVARGWILIGCFLCSESNRVPYVIKVLTKVVIKARRVRWQGVEDGFSLSQTQSLLGSGRSGTLRSDVPDREFPSLREIFGGNFDERKGQHAGSFKIRVAKISRKLKQIPKYDLITALGNTYDASPFQLLSKVRRLLR